MTVRRSRSLSELVVEADLLPRISGFASARANPVSDATRSKKRILIIDNDPNTTWLVKILLERSGPYLVIEENDATEAHQSACNFKPDVIFLEVLMPETDGGEVAAQIQADPDLRGTPIIFLTALVPRAEAKRGLHIQGTHLSPSRSAFPSCQIIPTNS